MKEEKKEEKQEVVYIAAPPEQETDPRQYFRAFWRRKFYFLVSILVVFAATVGYLMRAKPVYEAKVAIMVEKNTNMTIVEAIKPDNIDTDIEAKRIYLNSPTIKKSLAYSGEIKITKRGVSNIFELSVTGGEPGKATETANKATSILLKSDSEKRKMELEAVLEFLTSQTEKFNEEVRNKKEELAKIMQGEDLSSEPQDSGLVQAFSKKKEEATKAGIEAGLAEAQLQALRKRIEQRRTVVADAKLTPQVEDLRKRLYQEQNELSDALNRYTEEHPTVLRLKEKIASTQRQLKTEQERFSQTEGDPISELNSLLLEETQLDISVQTLKQKEKILKGLAEKFMNDHPAMGAKDSLISQIKGEEEIARSYLSQLQTRYADVSIEKELKSSGMSVISPADHAALVRPKKKLVLLIGGILGIFLGLGAVVFAEFLDSTVRTSEQARELTGLPVVGVIPDIALEAAPHRKVMRALSDRNGRGKNGNGNGKEELAAFLEKSMLFLNPKSRVAEAYRSLAAALRANREIVGNVVLITSSLPGEGKTTTAVNLAVTLARSGSRVVLVDADLHRPRIHEIFGFPGSTPGLAEMILKEEEPSSFLRKVVDNLSILCAGKISDEDSLNFGPSDLLSNQRLMAKIISSLKEEFDYVILDCPPAGLITSETVSLAQLGASVLFVLRTGSTKSSMIKKTKENLETAGANIFGVVLTFVNAKNKEEYPYSYAKYNSYYGSDVDDRRS
ncbi:MAG: polysaccharide biosynthesis tyrosine autokinase [Candidatus Pacebacteria bacterium]|nr:polysaccharide biosynthesis tyrosine autokinase [Candidatus Paceibacterota bacterium]